MYTFQIMTPDFELQIKTQVYADSISDLYRQAKDMVDKFPEMKGLKYGVWRRRKGKDGRWLTEALKIDRVSE